MDDFFGVVFVVGILFIGLPWLILHYVTRWKAGNALPVEDERLLDELYDLARRLEDRVHTVERIVAADNPDFRPAIRDTDSSALRDQRDDDRYDDRRDPRSEGGRLSYRPERNA